MPAFRIYDARGHAQNKSDGPHNLTFTYDRAERLTQVSGNGGLVLKTFAYGSSNATGSRTNGRLETATRYNSVGPPFNATGLRRPPGEGFEPHHADVLQRHAEGILHPGLVLECAGRPRQRELSAVRLCPVRAGVAHGQPILDTQANDPDMMRRPSAISAAKSGVTLWSSGAYKYDGSGNVVKTGNGYFLYDRVSRLIEGRIFDGATGGGTQKWQSYTYDPFGNIQSIGGTI